jgi:DNA-binding protein HU-beta
MAAQRRRRRSSRRGRRRPAGVNKAELVFRVARETGLTKADVLRVLDSILDHVARALKKGDRVTLVGFGTFLVGRRRSRAGYNPHKGEAMRIPGRLFPRFAAGKGLKELVR